MEGAAELGFACEGGVTVVVQTQNSTNKSLLSNEFRKTR